jgi:hypothetical protein
MTVRRWQRPKGHFYRAKRSCTRAAFWSRARDDHNLLSLAVPKLPPMPARDAGGSFILENPDDGTPIKEMVSLRDGLLIITENCTYRMQLADQIDPDRRNPALPHNVQRKLFDHGTKSELLCNTLLLAKAMFRKEFQPQLNIDRAMQLAFEALSELVAMHEAVQAFKSAEQTVFEETQRSKQQLRSWVIPSVGNIRTRCKTMMQKADHFAGALLKIVGLFYPEAKNWDDANKLANARYGEDDNFSKVMAKATPVLKLVRNARDCLEHRNEAGVATTDFELQQDGTLAPPTIEIKFRGSSQNRCSIAWFMEQTQASLLAAFEMIVVHMCSKHVQQPVAGLSIIVGPLPENYRAALNVRFAYGIYCGEQFAPFT